MMIKAKALTILQPYAQWWAIGEKRYETRSWATSYRGKIFIHAGLNTISMMHIREGRSHRLKMRLATLEAHHTLEFGYVIAVATLVDCVQMTASFINAQNAQEKMLGDWQPGRFAWKIENPRLITPIRVSGKQGLWDYRTECQHWDTTGVEGRGEVCSLCGMHLTGD